MRARTAEQPSATDGVDRPARRAIRRRRSLPGGRAVAGGLLVGLATLGIFTAYTDATAGPTTRYVVAATDLALGDRLTADDVRLEPMTLSPGAARRAYTSAQMVAGGTLVGPITAGELVQASDVIHRRGDDGTRELSFPIETDLALAGTLTPGERIDVLGTFGTGHDAYTVTVVADLPVVAVASGDGSLAGRFSIVTVALDTEDDVLALAHAVRSGEVLVVRSIGATRSRAVDAHRPPPPPADEHETDGAAEAGRVADR